MPAVTSNKHESDPSLIEDFKYFLAKGSDWNELKTVVKGITDDPWNDSWQENDYIRLIREQGGIFVNDRFLELWDIVTGLMFLDGGYGSSKTTYVITRLLVKCITNKYFRCYYGRQKKTEARNLHSNIITEIKRNKWEDLFDYFESATGITRITCKANGNKFELFGCDDVESLKGIDNPTDILVDEINQISFEAFGMLFTRLRGSGYDTQMIGCFNNCDVNSQHWIKKFIYGSEEAETDEERVLLKALKSANIVRHHSTYLDNLFQNPDAYYQKLVIKAGGNRQLIEAYCNGDWGVDLNQQPYYKNFNQSRDVVSNIEYDPKLPLHFSFDENVNPYFPCIIAQIDGMEIRILDEIAAKNPYNTLSWMCNEICKRYKNHKTGIYIYGDATSQKEDVTKEKGKNLFTMAVDYLAKLNPTLRVYESNPNNKIRQDFINSIFELNIFRMFILIHPKCKYLIDDLLNVSENPDGKKGGKDKRKETVDGKKGVQRWGHFGDCLDYLVCGAFIVEYFKFQSGGVSYDPEGGKRQVRNKMEEEIEEIQYGKEVDETELDEEDLEFEMMLNYRRTSNNSM